MLPTLAVVPQRLVEEVRRRQHEDDAGDEAVEEIHAKLRERKPLR